MAYKFSKSYCHHNCACVPNYKKNGSTEMGQNLILRFPPLTNKLKTNKQRIQPG